jgi:subtilisin family serine protease
MEPVRRRITGTTDPTTVCTPPRAGRRAVAALVAMLALAAAAAGGGAGVAYALAANEPALAQQWGMQKIGAPAAWDKGLTGGGITIGVVDSGVDLPHEDLAAKLVPGTDLVDPGTSPQDEYGHGTHVAGIAAAITGNGRGVTGVAPDASILPVRVLDEQGRGAANIDEGIRWAVDHGAQVVNVSIGDLLEPLDGPPFTEAIRYAWSKGVIPVLSAGNSFVFNSTFSDEPAIVVSATGPDDTIATYSNGVGDAAWGMAAPGGAGGTDEADDILSTYWIGGQPNQYAYLSGTSMAAPHVAGAAAVLRAAGLTPQQTVERLLSTAKDLGPPSRDSTYGAGRLDLAAAVSGLGGAPSGGGGGGTQGGNTEGGGAGGAGSGEAGNGGGSGSGSGGGTPPSGSGSPRRRTAGGSSGAAAGGPTTSAAPTTQPPAPVTAPGDDGAPEDARAGRGGDERASGDDDDAGGSGTPPLGWVVVAAALVVATGGMVPVVGLGRRRQVEDGG